MKRAELLKGISQIMAGLQVVYNSLEEDNTPVVEAVSGTVNTPVEEEVEEVEEAQVDTESFNKANLEAMSYNDLKKLAKDSGVSAKGSKDAIIERLLDIVEVEVETPNVDELVDEVLTDNEEVEEESLEEDSVEEDTEDDTQDIEEADDTQAMVERETADMSLEEIAEVLADIGKSTKGKRQSLIARLVEAVEEGLISFDDEEEVETTPSTDEEEEVESVEEVEEEEIEEADSEEDEEEESLADDLEEFYAEMDRDEAKALVKALGDKVLKKDTVESLLDKVREHDPETIVDKLKELGMIEDEEEAEEEEVVEDSKEETAEREEEDYFNEANMTATRKQAIADAKKQVLAQIKSGEITLKDIDSTLADFYLPHEGYEKSLPKQEKIDMYVEAFLRLIDDEGEENEFESPYYIDETPACCGHFLQDTDGTLYCEVCGTEYDSEEE